MGTEIEYRRGNILDYEGEYICQAVNSLGVMGAGLALQIRNKYPKVYSVYKSKDLKLGLTFGVKCDPHTILNIVAQKEIGRSALYLNYTALEVGVNTLNENLKGDIAFPMIGCGLAGGDWQKVKEILERVCTNINPIVYTLNDEVIY